MDASPVMEGRPTDLVAFRRTLLERLTYAVGKTPGTATNRDWFHAVALAVREYATDNWMQTTNGYYVRDQKRVYYLSLEFLIGRLLASALHNLGLYRTCQQALDEFQVDLPNVLEAEPDAALGNGGLGRLAACFMDSMATEGIAAHGYGIRYEFGLFEQGFDQGWQVEYPEDWLRFGNPWEFERPEVAYPVRFHGTVRDTVDHDNRPRATWTDTEKVLAIAYDTPVVGWGGKSINTLRLWSAKATRKLNLEDFNRGEYMGAVHQRVLSENLSRVLYPNDESAEGRELRLKQQYFFVCCSIADIIRRYKKTHTSFEAFPDKVAIQLNDTHPAITVAELMRVLIDQEGIGWDKAWSITEKTIAYTNHTLLPEALETWPVAMFERLLPRHLGIIYEINRRFLRQVQIHSPGDDAKLQRMSIVGDDPSGKKLRMAHLAVVGSHSVNGVAQLHSELVRKQLLPEFTQQPEFIDLFLREARLSATLDHANIIDKDAWSRLGEHAFDLIVLFGILHHIPEFDTRLKLMRRAAERLAPGGVLALSFWAFDAQRAKPLEIDAHDIDPDDLEPGDVLLPWDVDGAHRYCHLADETEIDRVAEALARCGLQSLDRFRSDGRSGDANTYLLLSTGRGEGLADAHYDGRNL